MHTTVVDSPQMPGTGGYLTICREVGARTVSALFLDMLIILSVCLLLVRAAFIYSSIMIRMLFHVSQITAAPLNIGVYKGVTLLTG